MPLYEYECLCCNKRFEKIRKISDRNKPLCCVACGTNTVLAFSSPNILSGAENMTNNDQKSLAPVTGGIQITNCTFENVNTGISLPEGAKVKMKGNKFKNVKTPVEFRKK